jgi:hypothetical protein
VGIPPGRRELPARRQAPGAHADAALGLEHRRRPPGSRISAVAPPPEEERPDIDLPAEDATVSFEAHIKPLFRASDRQSMQFAFDLWSHDDVSTHADAILERLQAGTMPCDGAWPPAQVDMFQRWTGNGKPR